MEYLSMNGKARYILVAEEVQGKSVSAYFVFDRENLKLIRMVPSKFMSLAARNNIVNAKETGGNLLGLQMSLRQLTRYNKDGAVVQQGLTVEQILQLVESTVDNRVYRITAKLAYKGTITAYVLEDRQHQVTRVTRNRMYYLYQKGRLPGYTVAKSYNDVIVSGGNIKDIPTYEIDYNGNIITASEPAKEHKVTLQIAESVQLVTSEVDIPAYNIKPQAPKKEYKVIRYVKCPWCGAESNFECVGGLHRNFRTYGMVFDASTICIKDVCISERKRVHQIILDAGFNREELGKIDYSAYASLNDCVKAVKHQLIENRSKLNVTGATIGLDSNNVLEVKEYVVTDKDGNRLKLDKRKLKQFTDIGVSLKYSDTDIINMAIEYLGGTSENIDIDIRFRKDALGKFTRLASSDVNNDSVHRLNKTFSDRQTIGLKALKNGFILMNDSKDYGRLKGLLSNLEDMIALKDLNKVLSILNSKLSPNFRVSQVGCARISDISSKCVELPGLTRHTANSLKAAYAVCRTITSSKEVIVWTDSGEHISLGQEVIPYNTQQLNAELDNIRLNDAQGTRTASVNKVKELVINYFGADYWNVLAKECC